MISRAIRRFAEDLSAQGIADGIPSVENALRR